MNIYLDIDGVLLTKDQQPAPHVVEFLEQLTTNHRVYWLTTHCQGDALNPLKYLKGKLPEEAMPYLEKIWPTQWATLKTEAIDFAQDFRWYDDWIMESERQVLADNKALAKFFRIDLKGDPDALKIAEIS